MYSEETRTFFIQYINTCNIALSRHKDSPPYKQILALSEKFLGNKPITVEVYGDDPDRPIDLYTIKLNNGAFDVVSYDKQEAAMEWKVKDSYLKTVVENSQHYIAHPEMLEWEWLKSRIGFSKSS
jgi:hypothetical protein